MSYYYISGNAKFNSISENIGVCIELCKLFASVHSMGYCFNGITGEDIIITQNKECKLLNDKKIVSVNDDSYEVNYEKTCAPEILINSLKFFGFTISISILFSISTATSGDIGSIAGNIIVSSSYRDSFSSFVSTSVESSFSSVYFFAYLLLFIYV